MDPDVDVGLEIFGLLHVDLGVCGVMDLDLDLDLDLGICGIMNLDLDPDGHVHVDPGACGLMTEFVLAGPTQQKKTYKVRKGFTCDRDTWIVPGQILNR